MKARYGFITQEIIDVVEQLKAGKDIVDVNLWYRPNTEALRAHRDIKVMDGFFLVDGKYAYRSGDDNGNTYLWRDEVVESLL